LAKSKDLRNYQFSAILLLIFLSTISSWSQEKKEPNAPQSTSTQNAEHLDVNWLYGAYIPKDAPLVSLTRRQRRKLFVRQTFTTPGIYIKTEFLALIDQARGDPYEWGGGFEGYGRRAASVYGQSAIQNVFSTIGNAALRYEPRYNRCRCDGLGPRTKHALMRTFLTYNHNEEELRPQFALYGAALGAGMLSSTWKPKEQVWKEGYQGVLTQATFGMLSNWIGEFAPEITRKLKRRKP